MEYLASNIAVPLDAMLPEGADLLRGKVARAVGLRPREVRDVVVVRRSVDARKKGNVHFVVSVAFACEGAEPRPARGVAVKLYAPYEPPRIPDLSGVLDGAARPVVVGAGPAGLFCALWLARAGMRPLVVERGQAVEQRQQSVQRFADGGPLDPDSNIQFGEGGAGTFSDGKLTCGKSDPLMQAVLHEFVAAGAPEDILIDAKPHIGTDYLPQTVRGIRQAIERAGGELFFETQLVGLRRVDEPAAGGGALAGAGGWVARVRDGRTGGEREIASDAVVLAIGHSARDTIGMLADMGASMQRKPFAVGVRIEHPQQLIDRAQYGEAVGHPALPPADYKLAVRTKADRGVYTFCMCPGGEVVAAASEPGGVCVNGMSNHARDGRNANSALLVEVHPQDLPGDDVMEGVRFQRDLEQAAYRAGSAAGSYAAPAQTVGGFLERASEASPSEPLPEDAPGRGAGLRRHASADAVRPTYPRGVAWADLRACLPAFVADSIAEALPLMDRKLCGFAHPDAVLTAVEARSSCPVRIVRDRATLQSTSSEGLFPTGEGAGYAGGIMSAATDGMRVALAVMRHAALRATAADPEGAAEHLRVGGALVFDTETVVGLGVAVHAAASPRALYALKGREEGKPISWLVVSPDALREYGRDVPAYAFRLAERFWPGPLTLIVRANDRVPAAFTSAVGTLGLRMPASRSTLDLIQRCGPLAATSANPSGERAPADLGAVDPELMLAAGCTLVAAEGCSQASGAKGDAADAPVSSGLASTVVDCTDGEPEMLREGSLTADILGIHH